MTTTTRAPAKDESELERDRRTVNERMAKSSVESPQNAWDSLWQERITPWDLGGPTPALQNELETWLDPIIRQRHNVYKSSTSAHAVSDSKLQGLPWRSLVPGCGSGYDIVSLARFQQGLVKNGIIQGPSRVVGLDISTTCLDRTAQVVQEYYRSEIDHQSSSSSSSSHRHTTSVYLVHGDFFDTSTWETRHVFGVDTSQSFDTDELCTIGSFDFVFDYTFFCALPPSLRKPWGMQMSGLLKSGKARNTNSDSETGNSKQEDTASSADSSGHLLTLMFPMTMPEPDAVDSTLHADTEDDDETNLQGPPFPVSEHAYRRVLEPHDLYLTEPIRSTFHSVAARAAVERVGWWKKE
jgi:methyl halide transferase